MTSPATSGSLVRTPPRVGRVVIASTWSFGTIANRAARETLARGGSALDAVVAGAQAVELDTQVDSVGYGGLPNSEGFVELDAGVMDGTSLRVGAVVALRDIRTPAAVARRVMERTRHAMLAAEGALRFACAQGFRTEETLTSEARDRWRAWEAGDREDPGHDTVGVVAIDAAGHAAAACTTSGLRWKLPGRVGDSPLVGSGFYADDAVGAAVATGIGEDIVRVCGSFLIVEGMRRGLEPAEAVREALDRLVARDPSARERRSAFIALRRDGACAGGSTRNGFSYAVTFDDLAGEDLVDVALPESVRADPVG
ncbi:MAG: isoaspartyl peptidase/L-asparaginase [Planctomycetes bacterium]|nr:isoaspartyl peptidase/L-asparaginase [Planctomycetota bacterium]